MKWKVNVTKTEKVFLIVLSVVLFAIVSFSLVFLRAKRPIVVAESQTASIAKLTVGMENVKKFYYFNRKETYYSVLGLDGKNQEVYVLVPNRGGKAIVLPKSKGLTEKQADSLILKKEKNLDKVSSTNIGIYESKPVWEVVAKLAEGSYCYYLLDFETGKIVNKTDTAG
ncbi:MAG: DUF5590 domain-containing protein [Lactobacillales bacterium]|jgi:uncharacterized protein YpmB|nr:DUF5590 domain-containing protein [Lactobacillales bacterium]